MVFRDLRADEIECRVAMVKDKGLSLLLYKDARCDMNILDETVGSMNWQRKHTRDNANCIVSIWDNEKKMWIEKEDTGTESNTEAEKGLASDSFKRACFNWGIGRELYTAPFIWITEDKCNIFKDDKGKLKCNDDFAVEDITIENKKIIALSIRNEKTGNIVYTFGKTAKTTKKSADTKKSAEKKVETKAEAPKEEAPKAETTEKKRSVGDFPSWIEILKICKAENLDARQIAKMYGLTGKTPEPVFDEALVDLKASLEADRKGE